jgi:hypothetical protein
VTRDRPETFVNDVCFSFSDFHGRAAQRQTKFLNQSLACIDEL